MRNEKNEFRGFTSAQWNNFAKFNDNAKKLTATFQKVPVIRGESQASLDKWKKVGPIDIRMFAEDKQVEFINYFGNGLGQGKFEMYEDSESFNSLSILVRKNEQGFWTGLFNVGSKRERGIGRFIDKNNNIYEGMI